MCLVVLPVLGNVGRNDALRGLCSPMKKPAVTGGFFSLLLQLLFLFDAEQFLGVLVIDLFAHRV